MNNKNRILLFTSIWEFIRVVLIFLVSEVVFYPVLKYVQGGFFWLVLLVSPVFIIPLGFFMVFINRTKYHSVIPLLRVGKIFSVYPCIVLLFMVDILFLAVLFLILLIDLIFFFLLISFNKERFSMVKHNQSVKKEQNTDLLPDFIQTEISDKD